MANYYYTNFKTEIHPSEQGSFDKIIEQALSLIKSHIKDSKHVVSVLYNVTDYDFQRATLTGSIEWSEEEINDKSPRISRQR